MGQSIPVGPWPDFETAQAFGGNALRAAADASGMWSANGPLHSAPMACGKPKDIYIRSGTWRARAATSLLVMARVRAPTCANESNLMAGELSITAVIGRVGRVQTPRPASVVVIGPAGLTCH
jgi:hypothetical protein